MTLNGGFSITQKSKVSEEDQNLIDEFIRSKGVTYIQPASADSNEASRATKERIAQARSDFRKAERNKNK